MPIRLFQDGEILDASDVNTYFMDQALVIFDDAAQRDAAFGGALEPGLSEGRICYLKDDDTIYIYTGAAWTAQLANIANGAITTAKLDSSTAGSEAVSTAKIRDGAVTSIKLGTDLSLTGTTKIEEIFEKAIINTTTHPSTGSPLTLDIANGAVYYYTTPCPHTFTLDITATGMVAGQALTLVFIMTSSATTGKVSLIKVNNTTPASVKWFGGNQYPDGSGGGAADAYTITIFKYTVSSVDYFHVFASQSKFA